LQEQEMDGSSKPKAKVHPGYTIVTELTKFWNSNTLGFDPYYSDGEMTEAELKRLITVLKRVGAKCRSAIDELKILCTRRRRLSGETRRLSRRQI
jgi:hypothetical protein